LNFILINIDRREVKRTEDLSWNETKIDIGSLIVATYAFRFSENEKVVTSGRIVRECR
jgi:hypothetical protein